MKFVFNERKAAQAAAYLLRKRGGEKTYGELIKLLYLADRKKILERGAPITGDKLVSMEHGTALSMIYDIIRDGPSEQMGTKWAEYVSAPSEYRVKALRGDTDELSRYELRLLDEIDHQFGHMTFWQLRQYTHRLGEWEDPHGSSSIIPPERILHVEGKSAEEIEEVASAADATFDLDRLLVTQ
jgi:uncharacterized phage-associated protein